MKGNKIKTSKRREFLKLAGLGAGVAGAAAIGIGTPKAQAVTGKPAGQQEAGYRESEQVKTYYRLARF